MSPRLMMLVYAVLAPIALAGATRADPSQLTVDRAWARATPGSATTGAVYFRIESPTDDRLISVASPVARKAEVHTHIEENGMMVMHEVEGGLAIPAGQTVELKSGGLLHVMLIDLKQKLAVGEMFPLVVTFEKAGPRTVMVKVERLGARDYTDEGAAAGRPKAGSGS